MARTHHPSPSPTASHGGGSSHRHGALPPHTAPPPPPQVGSFFDFEPTDGSYVLNPPFAPELLRAIR